MIRLKNLFILMLFILIVLTGCKMNSDNNDMVFDLVKKIYAYDELKDIYSFKGDYTLLNQKYRIEYVNELVSASRVVYRGKDRVVFKYYDSNDKYLYSKIYTISNELSDYDAIKIGDTVDSVKKRFYNGDYSFLDTGRNDLQKKSVHCTFDGYIVSIYYDENNMVSDVKSEKI